jgi:hypothetical protein
MKFRQLRAFCRVLQGNRLWRRSRWGPIRTTIEGEDKMCFCPLTYAYLVQTGEAINVAEFHEAGRSLGFSKTDIADIAAAGDGDIATKRRVKLWRIILKACGLTVTQRTS